MNNATRPPLLKRFVPIIVLTALCWLAWLFDLLVCQGSLNRFGIQPRHLDSLPGIIWAPFLHASFRHLAANTLPLLVLGGLLCGRGRGEFAVVTVAGVLLGGGLTWLFGRNACHIGASGLIFCYFGYLASLALFRRTFGALALSIVCLVAYGGMVRGIFPTRTPISWEGHLTGLITGVALAWLIARLKRESREPVDSPAPGVRMP
jgi:membrane associated rhomboid family serine protease